MDEMTDTMIDVSKTILNEYPLCNECLGRLFAWLATGTTNIQRGRSIKLVLLMIGDEFLRGGDRKKASEYLQILAGNGMMKSARRLAKDAGIPFELKETCHLCTKDDSVFERIPRITNEVDEILQDYEFDTFLVGSVPFPQLVERQDEICARYNLLNSEPLKSSFNREFGKKLFEKLKREVDFSKPEIVVIYDMLKDQISLQVNPLFIFGKYRKLERGIPQSRWDCGECKGKGCEECDGTGRRYLDSVSEYIGKPAVKIAHAARFKVHAAGREDIDALMLGDGRPFVLELSEPKKRKLNLEVLAHEINKEAYGKIEVHDLEFSERSRAQDLKKDASENIKEYVASISTEKEISEELLRIAEKRFKDIEIEQRTPNRVAHRRSDLVRVKHVYEIKLKRKEKLLLEGSFKVQGGTYIKELISGDEGRTKPSLTEVLETPCLCTELNVTAIYTGKPDHNA
ncbi:MAG: tRNA pseudouridine(54/55) synthase Pus10 [Candidatus Lokiarchaeota archaeon]|nr:tRNA pseudouridine(54/55) synthase Pus10 [Candidatus Lokiarchaeota archaeon]